MAIAMLLLLLHTQSMHIEHYLIAFGIEFDSFSLLLLLIVYRLQMINREKGKRQAKKVAAAAAKPSRNVDILQDIAMLQCACACVILGLTLASVRFY